MNLILALSLQHIPPPAEPPPRDYGICVYSAHQWHSRCITKAMSDLGECIEWGVNFIDCRTAFNIDIASCGAERLTRVLECAETYR